MKNFLPRFFVNFFVAALLVFAIGFGIGMNIHDCIYRSIYNARPVEFVRERYTVKEGDTLGLIAHRYQTRDYRKIFLPEFEAEISRLNPFLYSRRGVVKAGDELIIEYMIRK